MHFKRSSGILLHPTSLPGRYGIGGLGSETFRFIDWLRGAGQSIWQVLPLGPTGYGDSPYQCFSAFAGNPLLIGLEQLVEEGLLEASDLAGVPNFPAGDVDYGRVIEVKWPLLRKAARSFKGSEEFEQFCAGNAWWLDDFARFMALKRANGGVAWTQWTRGESDPEEIHAQKFIQFVFREQWNAVRAYAHAKGIRIMGDLPIYVAHDSSDVWANRGLFQLRDDGEPRAVAGVPPDYFSATGQLWGNPIYRWDVLRADGYKWWVERLRASFAILDLVRLDHFRGFESYWEVPGGEPTAVNGRWVKGPGAELFRTMTAALGPLAIVAENLGVITPEVEAIRHEFGYPGMAILQFAFGNDPQAPTFLPHNYPREVVAYSGTHDNETTVGWWTSTGSDSTRTADEIKKERMFACRYLNTDGREMHWAFVRALMASVASTVLIPMQDVLGLGNEARMNMPSRPSGNWKWRCRPEAFTTELQARLRELAEVYERV
jgi:4-alpha-glucanotransferase